MSKNCYSSCTIIWIRQNIRGCGMCELIIYPEQKAEIPYPNTPPPSSRPCCKIVLMDMRVSASTRSKSTPLSRRVPTVCLWKYQTEIYQTTGKTNPCNFEKCRGPNGRHRSHRSLWPIPQQCSPQIRFAFIIPRRSVHEIRSSRAR